MSPSTPEASQRGALLITGGGRGIGAATARLAAQRGYAVCLSYRSNRAAADSLAGEIEAEGGRALAVAADVSVEADVLRLFASCEAAFGRPVGIVNNAGVLETQARLDAMSLERWQRVFATNVFGAFLCAREAARARHAHAGPRARAGGRRYSRQRRAAGLHLHGVAREKPPTRAARSWM